ncbi:pyruvate carboxylase [Granulicatella balaenopterae]|uniref:Pyruvate carboxylase n=1 Tax=Granulicatella balaenopterae TaxID=137733 RepID=A0A1H9IB10_9LACT|nr:pyruvate carboxylase [Granulicatella balaenopterae]SEQ71767.1 pyruvate carboxylase [Granulicatella balaenopterae]
MKKILVANRGEIAIRVFRAASELGMETVGIFAKEDEQSLHRYKADEAYLVGEGKKPIDAYLDIDDIIRIAKMSGADAIHPGYGFLSENIEFAKKCLDNELTFIGPDLKHLDILGDKLKAKDAALKAGLQSIPGTEDVVASVDEIYAFGEEYGYPIMIKAALGGGGRGMRVVRSKDEVEESYKRASGEAIKAFGAGECYVEKYIEDPQHIEVQILGDTHGNVVHLFERDCSVQRRHQKVIEVAPCVSLSEDMRQKICLAARDFMQEIGYVNAGTVEFLLDKDKFYFIEVNPRIQVEHTISELITGIDIVQAQLQIAQGMDLHKDINIPKQVDLTYSGAAIQCRITTEDPLNNFLPDTGKINTYRSPGGFGIRLDAGNAFQGNVVTPHFDSLLVKVCTYGRDFEQAVVVMQRALREFRIRGVKTNIPFMKNVVNHPLFLTGEAKTTFIDNSPELFEFPQEKNRGNKLMRYISEITINGFPGIDTNEKHKYQTIEVPSFKEKIQIPTTAKNILDTKGALGVNDWVKSQEKVLLTDTTFRDAHQSLFATRMRSNDLITGAKLYEQALPELFSAEVWGGATFDTAYRFLTEDPWERLEEMRKAMPNTLLQMLLRGSNAVGYQNYPDNVIREFIKESAKTGVDVFRIFDSLNWLPQMELSIDAVREAGKIAEAAICYTGDILDPMRQKYSLNYYKTLAQDLEKAGATIIGVKDMAGLLKPEAAYQLISTLKEAVDLPIHLHTHDTSGNGLMTYKRAMDAGVDIVDCAISSMAGGTSQPSMESFYYATSGLERQPSLTIDRVRKVNHYWADVRKQYDMFDKGQKSPSTAVYQHEMPGGQYTNLQQQAKAVGLGDSFEDVEVMYHTVNNLFGDIIKVTPSSKVVGDMTLFMLQNGLDEKSLFEKGKDLDFPQSVIKFFKGDLGQPVGGFPKELQQLVLKGEEFITDRPGLHAAPVNFDEVRAELEEMMGHKASDKDVLSYILYPKVFTEYLEKYKEFGVVTQLDTPTFFHGMETGEKIEIVYAPGKSIAIRLVQIGEPDSEGNRIMFYRFNGQGREIVVKDRSVKVNTVEHKKADPSNAGHVGATMPGSVLQLAVKVGEKVEKGQAIIVTEAMKMETTINAPISGIVSHILVEEGDQIQSKDLLIEISEG